MDLGWRASSGWPTCCSCCGMTRWRKLGCGGPPDSTPHDRFVARVTFDWAAASPNGSGTVRLERANIPITARIGTDQFLRGGESRRLPPGRSNVVVSAPGFLSPRLTVEHL